MAVSWDDDQYLQSYRGNSELTIIIFIDQWNPTVNDCADETQNGRISCFIGQSFQLRPRDDVSDSPRNPTGLNEAYLVYVCQIGPRNRYHKMSRSRRAYSARSRAAEGGTLRRQYLDRNSNARERYNGLGECGSTLNAPTVVYRLVSKFAYWEYQLNELTVYKWSEYI